MLLNILQCTRCLPGKDVLFLPRVTPLIPLFQPLPKENYLAEIVHKTASEKIWSWNSYLENVGQLDQQRENQYV